MMRFAAQKTDTEAIVGGDPALRQWPIELKLVNPGAESANRQVPKKRKSVLFFYRNYSAVFDPLRFFVMSRQIVVAEFRLPDPCWAIFRWDSLR